MKVYMPKPAEDWICDVVISEFAKHTRHEMVDHSRDSEVIYLWAKWIWNRIPPGLLASRKVITSVHHVVPQKVTWQEFQAYNTFTNVYHVPNDQTAVNISSFAQGKQVRKIIYWSNPERWKILPVDKVNVEGSLGFDPENRVLLASFQRDTEGDSIGPGCEPKPKLEKGPDIYVDILRRFKDHEALPFVPGWRRNYICNELRHTHKVVSSQKLHNDSMNLMYNIVRKANGYYLVTSRYEGGPQAIFEAALNRVRILSTDVGMAKDVLHPDCICKDPAEFEHKIRTNAIDHTLDYNFKRAMEIRAENIIPLYDDLIDEVASRE